MSIALKKVKVKRIILSIMFIVTIIFGKSYSKDILKDWDFHPSKFFVISKFEIDENFIDILRIFLEKNKKDLNFLNIIEYSSTYFFSTFNKKEKINFLLLKSKKKSAQELVNEIHKMNNKIFFKKFKNNFYSVINDKDDFKIVVYENGSILWIINFNQEIFIENDDLEKLENFLSSLIKVGNEKEKKDLFNPDDLKKDLLSSKFFLSVKMTKSLFKKAKYFNNIEFLLKNLKYSYVKVDNSLKHWSLNLVYSTYIKGKKEMLMNLFNKNIELNFAEFIWLFENKNFIWDANTLKITINFPSKDQILNLLTLGTLYYSDKIDLNFLVKNLNQF